MYSLIVTVVGKFAYSQRLHENEPIIYLESEEKNYIHGIIQFLVSKSKKNYEFRLR